jgi:hypothetical protein
VRILVIRPGLKEDQDFDKQTVVQRLIESGADKVAVSITEAQMQITQLLFSTLVQPTASTPTMPESQPAAVTGSIVTSLPSSP